VARGVRWLSDDEQHAWRSYRRMKGLLDLQLARDMARDSGLSEADYDVLSTLTEDGGRPWRGNELAARLLWSSSRLAHHVGRMERRGLVVRTACDDDRRGALIDLTECGRATLEAAARRHVASVRKHFIDLLSPDEIHELGELASRVVQHLQDTMSSPTAPARR
jgi:DNA-binding MarR family transcriptional regulator